MERTTRLEVITCCDLPENPDQNSVYCLLPKNVDEAYYWERVDRNVGWITREEQEMLRSKVIGIAGCGGMGGMLAQIFVRLGVGEVRIADIERFDVSNINRQFAATRSNVGELKAFATTKMLRGVTDDTKLVIYPQGIVPQTVDSFLFGCDVVCDEIEFWAVGARILLHQRSRALGIPVFNCNTIGFGTRLFLFTQTSATMEECLGLTYEKAVALQEKVQKKTATPAEIKEIQESVLRGLLPEIPNYRSPSSGTDDREILYGRLFNEGRATIVATNPSLATGFLADHLLLYILGKESVIARDVVAPPEMPGYLYFDAAKMEAKVVRGRWW